MISPAHSSSDPNLVFTEDYHQLVRGQLSRNVRCTISYDPDRIVPDGDPYKFGDPNRLVRAFVKQRAYGPAQEIDLHSWSGQMEFAPTTLSGEGPTLKGEFTIAPDAEWISIWFEFTRFDGGMEYDSNLGKNFTFRFLEEELQFLDVWVQEVPGNAMDKFVCKIQSPSSIDSMTVRYRVINSSTPQSRTQVPMTKLSSLDNTATWELENVWVPHAAVVQFDVEFYSAGEKVQDDNQGRFYLAAWPEKMAAALQTLKA